MHRYCSSLLLKAASNWKHKLYINSMNTIDSTLLFFGIFIRFYLWYWNIITNERKMWEIFCSLFLLSFRSTSKEKVRERKVRLFSGTMASTRAHLFSSNHPFLSLSFMANSLGKKKKKHPLAHHSPSPEQQSVCTHVAKPWPFLSILLTRMLSSLVCSFLSWWTYFRRLVVIFHICLGCASEPYDSLSSLTFHKPLQRLGEVVWWAQAQSSHSPKGAQRTVGNMKAALVCTTIFFL